MPQNNIITFPGPKERSRIQKKEPEHSKKDQKPAPLSGEKNIIPLHIKKTQTRKKPSKNPYKAWSEKSAQGGSPTSHKPDLIKWPSEQETGDPKPPQKKPYVFAGTGLSFLLLVAGLMVLNQKKGTDRQIASEGDYISSIRIVKDGIQHNVLLYENERGKLSINLVPENNRQPNSEREPDNEDMLSTKTRWRNQEKRALYLINTGQRKIVQMGQKPL